MKSKDMIISVLITLILSAIVILLGIKEERLNNPQNVYEVYLNGKALGYLDSEEEFLALVDNKQNQIKDKYNVDKVYPPSGLVIEKVSTYDDNINTSEQIYNIIEENEVFTVDGYQVTIKYEDKNKEPKVIYALDKEFFETAFYNTVATFVGTIELEKYKNNTQEEITDVGTTIDSIYWREELTIKKTKISTEETIFTNEEDLSKYILFGTTEEQKKYKVKDGDTIDDILERNNLSIEEFLIANPSIPNSNVLLTKDQEVSIGLISPLITVVHEVEKVEDISNKYTTEYQNDNTMYSGQTKVIQEGKNGKSRVTEKIEFENGAIKQLYIIKSEEVSPTVNKIVAKGTKVYTGYPGGLSNVDPGNDEWFWPTTKPYVITSRFGWRWGKHHNGIDISGTGFGSPIYASYDGTVTITNSSCSDQGYYGSNCGMGWGNYVRVVSSDGKYQIIYAHMTHAIRVKVGDTVKRGQLIGQMGNSGSSTGTHLHFSILDSAGRYINPCAALSC